MAFMKKTNIGGPQSRRLHDVQFSSIKDTLRKKNKEKKAAENVVMECYVDSTRRLAVNLSGGAGEDLKRIMGDKKMLSEEEAAAGIANDVTYLKQAEHLLRTANYDTAIKYTVKALELNPESKHAMTLLARVYLLTNDWGNAMAAADMVLEIDKRSTKARLVKAEALFNICQFEHAMVHFNRGMAASRDREQTETFRLGVQKCRKIIYDCVPPDPNVFHCEGVDVLFKLLRQIYEGREMGIAEKEAMEKKGPQLSFATAMNLAAKKKQISKNAKEQTEIRAEEELTKRNVKTIMDEEAAALEREALKEARSKLGQDSSSKAKLLNKRMAKIGKGAAAARTVVHNYELGEMERAKKKVKKATDRLKPDKRYLHALSRQLTKRTDISDDTVHTQVIEEAEQVLFFLKQRDAFWDQLSKTARS